MRWLLAVCVLMLASAQAHAMTADEEMVRLTEKVESVAQGDSGNCSKMASDLRALHDQNEPLIQRLRATYQNRRLSRAYEPRFTSALKGIVGATQSCAGEPSVGEALDDFPR